MMFSYKGFRLGDMYWLDRCFLWANLLPALQLVNVTIHYACHSNCDRFDDLDKNFTPAQKDKDDFNDTTVIMALDNKCLLRYHKN